jgi:hypothetical protein
MDGFISIIKKTIISLYNGPLLLLAGAITAVLSLPALLMYGEFDTTIKAIVSNYASIILPLMIMPFFIGGALGYAIEMSQNGSSSLKTFIGSGIKHYTKLLMAGIIAFIIFFILGFSLLLVLFSTGVAGDAFIAAILSLVSLTLMFIGLMMIEFYDISIVSENSGILQSFSKSIDFVKKNFAMVLPYFIIIIIIKALTQVPLVMGMTVEFLSNETYFTNLSYMNATYLGASETTLKPPALISIAIFQCIIQAFVFAFTLIFKSEFFLGIKSRKKITDFDYDFSDEKP